MNLEVDVYLQSGCGRCPLGDTPQCKVHNWEQELVALREIVLSCGLTDEIKWSVPCYTFSGKNIAIVSAFKNYAALSFFKGSLLQDAENRLVAPGENAQEAKMFRFTNVKEIQAIVPIIRAYIFEAIEVEKAGIKPSKKVLNDYEIPEELTLKLKNDIEFRQFFEALTPGRKKGYYLYFSAPKQAVTRASRIEKSIEKIKEGKGYNER